MRRQELPDDIIIPIRIAAGCGETCWDAVLTTQLGQDRIREAARTYLQLVLFSDEGDCYRVLGVHRGASTAQMREHMRWLMQWLHPDRNAGDWESVYAERVPRAWREAKAEVASSKGKQQLTAVLAKPSLAGNGDPVRSNGRLRAPMRWVPMPIDPPPSRIGTPLRIGAVVFAIGLILFIVPRVEPVSGWIARADQTDGR